MAKIVLAFDSFKGSLTAPQACQAAAEGVARLSPAPEVMLCPLSDGGEGFAEALRLAAGGQMHALRVTGPLGKPTRAELVWLTGATAVVESAQACGLHLVPPRRRSPWQTTSYGVGEMLAAAVLPREAETPYAPKTPLRRIVVGLGGSATNDGGMGLLAALGWQFLDADDNALPPIGASLARVQRIVPGHRLSGIEIVAACDVTNPLYGPHGAAHTFAPQKGAVPAEVIALDEGMRHYAAVCADFLGTDYADRPGAGAAGGLGFALLAFFGATFQPGAQLAIALSGLSSHLRGADLCLTGEGQTDFQTAYGKLPAAVAACCVQAAVPCVCLSGALGRDWHTLYQQGFTAILSIAQRPTTLREAIRHAPAALADTAEAVARLRT